jgi:hypothetical protein
MLLSYSELHMARLRFCARYLSMRVHPHIYNIQAESVCQQATHTHKSRGGCYRDTFLCTNLRYNGILPLP